MRAGGSRRELRAVVVSLAAVVSVLFLIWAILSAPDQPAPGEILRASDISPRSITEDSQRALYQFDRGEQLVQSQPAHLKQTPPGWEAWVRSPEMVETDGSVTEIPVRSSVFYTSNRDGSRALAQGLSPTPDQLALSIQWIDRDSPLYETTAKSAAGVKYRSPLGLVSVVSDGRVGLVHPRDSDALILLVARTPGDLIWAIRNLKISDLS